MYALVAAAHAYARAPSSSAIQQWRDRHRELQHQLAASNGAEVDAVAVAIQSATKTLREDFERAALLPSGPSNLGDDSVDPQGELLLARTQDLANTVFRWTRDKLDDQQKATQALHRTAVVAIAVLAFLLFVQGVLVVVKLLHPLRRLEQVTDAIAAGDRQRRVATGRTDEIGRLEERFDAMTIAIAGHDESLHLEIARREQSERLLKAIADHIPGLVAYIDNEQRYRFVNERFREAFGKGPEAFIGNTMREMLGEAIYGSIRHHIEAALRGEAVRFERNTTELGKDSHHVVEYIPNLLPDGSVQGFHALVRDISERKQAELQLARNEERIRGILTNAPDAFLATDQAGILTQWNAQAERTFGWRRDEVLGMPLSMLLTPEASAGARVLDVHAFGSRLETTAVHKAGRQIPVELSVASVSDGDGLATIAFLHDISARKLAENAVRQLTDIFDHTPDFIVQTDWKGRLVYLNPAIRAAAGIAPDHDVTGQSFAPFYTDETDRQLREEAGPYAKKHGVWIGENEALLKGRRIPVSHLVLAHRDERGRIARYSSVMRDISSQAHDRNLIHRQAQMLSSIAEAIPAVVAAVGPDDTYRFVNSAFERWRGLPREQLLGKHIREVLGELEFAISAPHIRRALAGETATFERDSYYGTSQHTQMVSYIPLRLPDGRVDGFVGLVQDITVHKQEELRLLRLSELDPLTQVLNRQGLETYLEQRHDKHEGLALLYVDLDRFKPVNDTYGHPMGDALLKAFAERLQKLIRPTDIVARLGGDEFAIVLPDIKSKANADAVADKVVAAASTPFRIGQLDLHIGASVGVALADADGWDGLVRRADKAVYRAKETGRGRRA